MTRRTSSPPLGKEKVFDGFLLKSKTHALSVGIDASLTNTAVVAVGADGTYYGWLIQPKCQGVPRLGYLRDAVTDVLNVLDFHPTASILGVAIEGYSMGSRNSQSHSIGEGGGVIKLAVCEYLDSSIPFYKVPPNTVKKFTTDNGAAKKNEMLLGVYKKWKVEFNDDNVADAYALAKAAAALTYDSASALKYETEALKKAEEV